MYFNAATDGTLSLEVSTDAGSTWASIWSMTGDQGNVWHDDQVVSLAAYANSFLELRFSFTMGSLGTSYQYDCALDDIVLSDINSIERLGDDVVQECWQLLGNSGTTTGTNFLGTIDAVELDFRTNNTVFMRLTTKGQIETYNTGQSVFIGEGAGESDDLTANLNVIIGRNAAYNSTTSQQNVVIGNAALYSGTTGNSNNVAIGYNAMTGTAAFTSSAGNVAVGSYSLRDINGGDYNVALGYSAMENTTTGSNNLGIGRFSLYENTSGEYNIGLGSYALYYNTTGVRNIAQGYQAMYNATTSNNYNVAVGDGSMHGTAAFTNSLHNIAIGYNSLYSISGGDYNISIGHESLILNNTGSNNIAIGDVTLSNNSSGYENIAIGSGALLGNTTGYNNIAIGEEALWNNSTGYNNVAIGYWACHGDANGVYNTGVGRYVLYQNQGNYNTGIGYAAGAGAGSPTYTYCSFLGYDADATGSYNNAMALGYNASVTASNRVRVGNTTITRIGGQVGWSTLSDGRVKENVTEDVTGIDFIMQLRPVTFNINKDKQDEIIGRPDSSEYAGKYNIENIRFSGFIAQEVEEAAAEVGYDFSGVKKPAHDNDLYGLTYSEFVVPLVKATQEQQEIIEDQNERIGNLEKEIEELKLLIENLTEQE